MSDPHAPPNDLAFYLQTLLLAQRQNPLSPPELLESVYARLLMFPQDRAAAIEWLGQSDAPGAFALFEALTAETQEVVCPSCRCRRKCLPVDDDALWLPERRRLCTTCGLQFRTEEVADERLWQHARLRSAVEQLADRMEHAEIDWATLPGGNELAEVLKLIGKLRRADEQRRAGSVMVDSLKISMRLQNILCDADVETIDQLCRLTAAELLTYRHMTAELLQTLRERLAERGRRLSGE